MGTVLVELEVLVLEGTMLDDDGAEEVVGELVVKLLEGSAWLLDDSEAAEVKCGNELVDEVVVTTSEGCSDELERCDEPVVGAVEVEDCVSAWALKEVTELDVGVADDVDVTAVEEELLTLKSSRRLPSPQYWYGLPAHFMLHSLRGAALLVACSSLPQ